MFYTLNLQQNRIVGIEGRPRAAARIEAGPATDARAAEAHLRNPVGVWHLGKMESQSAGSEAAAARSSSTSSLNELCGG